ncbi:nucleotide exchange factor SIL1 [Osmerus mordax]|uniref:nucleotide exchange factor SIL1 n=1 Tax=Osmerus mordax TaxID=8014 RepID=UPI00350EBB0D
MMFGRPKAGPSSHLKNLVILVVFSLHFVDILTDKSLSALTVVDNPESTVEDEEVHLDGEGDTEDLEVVQPTLLWQTLKPGKRVPIGSHVRLNLQTGQREVRLGEEQLKYLGDKHREVEDNGKAPLFSTQELKNALKKLKEGVEPETTEQEETAKESVRSQFRPIEELKKDMAQLDILVESDSQIMARLVAQFNGSLASLEERLKVLLDLEYLVHQVDNAQNLASMGGLKLVIESLNSTDHRMQENAAFVLGSALSSNPVVQVEAVDSGALQKLLTMLATPHPMAVKKKVLFALAALLRHFPFAQNHFLKLGGLHVLGELFRGTGGEILRVRVVTMVYDMIMEKELNSQTGLDIIPDTAHQERLHQYSQISLLPLLAEQGWCGLVPELLESPEHDWREKALRALLAMLRPCRGHFRQDRGLTDVLGALRGQYQELVVMETSLGEEGGYFGEILDLLNTLVLRLK